MKITIITNMGYFNFKQVLKINSLCEIIINKYIRL